MLNWISKIFQIDKQKQKTKSIEEFVEENFELLKDFEPNPYDSIGSKNPDFVANLIYKTVEEGGRQTAAMSGYRPAIKFPFSNMQTSGSQYFVDDKKVFPGDRVKANIKIVSVDFFKNQLSENLEFEFYEGSRLIGTGVIIEVLNPILNSACR